MGSEVNIAIKLNSRQSALLEKLKELSTDTEQEFITKVFCMGLVNTSGYYARRLGRADLFNMVADFMSLEMLHGDFTVDDLLELMEG